MTAGIEEAAAQLRAAHDAGTPCAPILGLVDRNDPETGYAVQELNTRRWLDEGRRLVGRKIGLTSDAVQQQMGVDQPDFGMLFADMEVADGESIVAGRLMQPRLEGEVAFTLGRDITDISDQASVTGAIDHARVAGEIVDSRVADWKISIVDTVADNASSGLFVLGEERVGLENLDFLGGRMEIERRGEICSAGGGAACLGHPLRAVLWLANMMVEVGRPLEAGDIVLSGAWGPLVPVLPGDELEVRITGLGSVRACFGRR
jgi:2-keto-4-pentenoate hydratase